MLNLEFELAINNENGRQIAFVDTTVNYGQGGNVNYSDIKATRFLFQNYLSVQQTITLVAGDVLEQYREYIKTAGSASSYDNKVQSAGSIFIPFIDLTVNTGDEWETLAVYSPFISYLPDAVKTPLITTTVDWGIDQEIFPDTVYALQYEVYKDTSPTTLTNVTNEMQYIVTGTGTCTYNGDVYRSGEVFIAVDNGGVSFTGSANLKILEASRQKFYIFTWELLKRFYEQVAANLDCCGPDYDILKKIELRFDALKWMNLTQQVSSSNAQKSINWINERLTYIEP